MFERIILSIFLFAIGIAILKYRKMVHGWTGTWLWAEKYLGRGGTYTALVLAGLGFILIAVMYLFGQFDFNQELEIGQGGSPLESKQK